jgi:hypothetical protein
LKSSNWSIFKPSGSAWRLGKCDQNKYGQSNLPQRRCLANLGIPRQTFYRWYDSYLTGGPEALADKPSRPDRVWNRIPDAVQGRIIDLALTPDRSSPATAPSH